MKKEKEKDKQLKFGLKNNPKNIYFKYKDQYELWLAGLETKRYLKDPLLWFTIIFSSTFVFTQVYLIVKGNLPSEMPIFKYYIANYDRLAPSNLVFLFPVLGGIILLFGVFLSRNYYHKERELSKILMIAVLLTNLSLCLIFFRLLLMF